MKVLRLFTLLCAAGVIFSSCQKELDFGGGAPALGTLKATSGDCLPVTINGTYEKDTLLKSTNTVDVQVDITQLGTYTIKTDTINGYSFSATGVAGVLGVNTIHLLGSGRPIAPSVDVFTITFDTSHCQINVVVTGAGGGGGGGSTGFITAIVDGAATPTTFNYSDTAIFSTNTALPGYIILDITGTPSATSNDAIDLGVAYMGATIPTGTYDVSGSGIPYFVGADYYIDATTTDYSAITTGTNPTPTFTLTITAITATRVQGTFSGAVWENGSGPVTHTFTSGTFDVPR